MKSIILVSALCLFFLMLSVVVGTRDISVGADTAYYTNFFHNVEYVIDTSRFELLFKYFTYSIKSITDIPELYFIISFLLFNFFYIYFYFRASGESRKVEHLFILIGLMLSSSWYSVATTNGLRQGLSLPLLYMSLFLFSERKIIFSILLCIASLGFHKACVLALPFFFLVFLRARLVLFVFIFTAFLYLLGITEFLVDSISDFLSISLY
ncbi:MAG: EpsG family protein, partial [Thiomicrorhabdus sp.]|nr:EpsG family protein [Thiomicrorhabdus sp.]